MLDETFKDRVQRLVHPRFEECAERARGSYSRRSAELAAKGHVYSGATLTAQHEARVREKQEQIDAVWEVLKQVAAALHVNYSDTLADDLKAELDHYASYKMSGIASMTVRKGDEKIEQQLQEDFEAKRQRAVNKIKAEIDLFVDNLRTAPHEVETTKGRESNRSSGNGIEAAVKLVQETYRVPADSVRLYARLWELETWLREMVYVELKSARGAAWGDSLKDVAEKVAKDKQLIHMATPQRGQLAYLTLGELWEIIKSTTNWPFFETYFPPKQLVEAKLATELLQIRHRVAHCRYPHRDDLARVEQFLRDIDQSFWKFTTSYNKECPITPAGSDPVATAFIEDDQYPWVEVESNTWARLGRKVLQARYTLTVDWTIRPWVDKSSLKERIAPNPGVLYDVGFQALDGRSLAYDEILSRTQALHARCIHVILDSSCSSIRITLPSVLPLKEVIETIEAFREPVLRSIQPRIERREDLGDTIASRWPEYVIAPSNPLSFLCPDMPCTFFPQ